MPRLRPIATALALTLLVLAAFTVQGYDNDDLGRTRSAGPHRTLNALSVEAFIQSAAKDSLLSRYDFRKPYELTGTGVTEGGWTHLNWKEGDRKGTWRWWVAEGGYTADEPELYASFRHFYDPRARNGATHLTDHLQDLERYWSYIMGGTGDGIVNPKIDARDWAIQGPQSGGLFANPYAWDRGVEYLRAAMASTGSDKDRLFVKAWRSLGETMHLMADMACVPHVRNDSHPAVDLLSGDPHQGLLRSDPYETLCREALISRAAGEPLDPEARRRIDQAKDPMLLFYGIASYTQDRFFSADTVSGTDRHGRAITSANGCPDYPSPKLTPQMYDPATGAYRTRVAGRDLALAHESWLGANGWGSPMHAVTLSAPSVRDQAAVLIPVAVAANQRLMSWFIPRLELKLTSWDPASRILKGELVHHTGGAHPKPLVFNAGPHATFAFTLDGSLQNWDRLKLDVRNNRVTLDLSRLTVRDGQSARLELELGGLAVRSNPLPLGAPAPKPVAATWTRYVDVSFHCMAGYSSSLWRWGSTKPTAFMLRDYGPGSLVISPGGSFSGSYRHNDTDIRIQGRIEGSVLRELTWDLAHKSTGNGFTYQERLQATFRDIPWVPENEAYMLEFINLDNLRPIPNPRQHVPTFTHEIRTSDGKTLQLTNLDLTSHGIPRGKDGGADTWRLLHAYRPLISVRVYELDAQRNPRR